MLHVSPHISLVMRMQTRSDPGLLLTRLPLPMDLLLTVGPLANVDIDGSSVPPKAISTSFGGCLKSKKGRRRRGGKKNNVNPCGAIPFGSSEVHSYSPQSRWSSVRCLLSKKIKIKILKNKKFPHLINENLGM